MTKTMYYNAIIYLLVHPVLISRQAAVRKATYWEQAQVTDLVLRSKRTEIEQDLNLKDK